MAKREYKNGYQEKIQYWTGKLNEAIKNARDNGSWDVTVALDKINYFSQKHTDLMCTGTIEDVPTEA